MVRELFFQFIILCILIRASIIDYKTLYVPLNIVYSLIVTTVAYTISNFSTLKLENLIGTAIGFAIPVVFNLIMFFLQKGKLFNVQQEVELTDLKYIYMMQNNKRIDKLFWEIFLSLCLGLIIISKRYLLIVVLFFAVIIEKMLLSLFYHKDDTISFYIQENKAYLFNSNVKDFGIGGGDIIIFAFLGFFTGLNVTFIVFNSFLIAIFLFAIFKIFHLFNNFNQHLFPLIPAIAVAYLLYLFNINPFTMVCVGVYSWI